MGEDTALAAGQQELTAHRRPLKALTGIRFFAAYFVVIFHSRLAQTLLDHHLIALGNFFGNGFLAVPLFFILSGFILAYTYKGQIERPGDHRRFWEARFARIWPVYAVSLLCSSIPSLTFPRPLPALATLLMVQAWNPFNRDMAGTWNFVCWTLSVEALFYLCFPWVQTWIERKSASIQLIWIGVMLALCVGFDLGGSTLGYIPPFLPGWIPLPILHLPEFFIGVGLGNYFLRRLALQKPGATSSILRGSGVWTYAATLLTLAFLCRAPNRWTSICVACFAALVFGLAAERTLISRLLSTPLIVLGGGISYSVYLMQMPVKSWTMTLFDRWHIGSGNLRLSVTFALLTLISLILFKTVEDPARRLIRGFFARLEQRRGIKA